MESSDYETLEEAALADWPAAAGAHVVDVTTNGDEAEVLVDTEPSHPMIVVWRRENGRWMAILDYTA